MHARRSMTMLSGMTLFFCSGTLLVAADTARAAAGNATLYVTCTPAGKVTMSSHNAQADGGAAVETVDAEKLLLVKDGMRAGSATVKKTCGAFEVMISGGVFNADAFDSMGADRSFPVVDVVYRGTTVVHQKRIGTCDTSSDNPSELCPEAWAENLSLTAKDGGDVAITINGKPTDAK